MIRWIAMLAVSLGITTSGYADEAASTLNDTAFLSITTLQLQMAEPVNRRIPASLRLNARCVAVFPSVVKAGLIVAAKHGNGLVSCRHHETGQWGAPAVFSLTAASIGIQAGIQSASYVLLFLDEAVASRLLTGEVSFGSDVGITAGPVGAAANYSDSDGVLSYVRTAGLFAGVDLEGARLSFATDANQEVYGDAIDAQQTLFETDTIPPLFAQFHEALGKFAPNL